MISELSPIVVSSTLIRSVYPILLGLIVLVPMTAHAQVEVGQRFSAATESQPQGAQAYWIESAGATAGSLLGYGVVYLARDGCPVEDLGCTLRLVGAGIALSTMAAVLGDHLAGKLADTRPSTLGATIGALAGAAAGVGAWHLFTEELDISNKPAVAILAYSMTQGLLTAAGSRIARSMR